VDLKEIILKYLPFFLLDIIVKLNKIGNIPKIEGRGR